MHTVSLNEIYACNPCKEGIKELLLALETTQDKEYAAAALADKDLQIPYDFIINNCEFNNAIWGLRCNERGVKIAAKFAQDCADHVSHLNNYYSRFAAKRVACAATYAVDTAYAADTAAYTAAYAVAAAIKDASASAFATECKWQIQQLLKLINE